MKKNSGFTLVELMITMAMTGIIVGAVYSTYVIQKKSSIAQEQVVEMQQNLRAATITMVQELRMAGYDPTTNAGATVVAPTAPATAVSSFSFQQDLDGDGALTSTSENVSYGFAAADDADGDGIVDSGFASLGRNTGGGLQPIAENIQAIEFLYTLKDYSTTTTPTAADFSDIRTATISILAAASQRDAKFINSTVYVPASGNVWDLNGATAGTAPNDSFRRRLLITTVQCRNMGL